MVTSFQMRTDITLLLPTAAVEGAGLNGKIKGKFLK